MMEEDDEEWTDDEEDTKKDYSNAVLFIDFTAKIEERPWQDGQSGDEDFCRKNPWDASYGYHAYPGGYGDGGGGCRIESEEAARKYVLDGALATEGWYKFMGRQIKLNLKINGVSTDMKSQSLSKWF
jgi:hypothetical protein